MSFRKLILSKYKNIEDEIVLLRDENAKHQKDAQNAGRLQAEAKSSKALAENLKKEIDEVRTKYDKSQSEANSKVSE
jgi:hypothetical protein